MDFVVIDRCVTQIEVEYIYRRAEGGVCNVTDVNKWYYMWFTRFAVFIFLIGPLGGE